MGKIKSLSVLVCMLSVANAWAAGFLDDFDRPDGEVGNGWLIWTDGGMEPRIVDNEVLIAGQQGRNWYRSGIYRPVEDETRFAFDFKADDSFNVHIELYDPETPMDGIDFYAWPGGPFSYGYRVEGDWTGWIRIPGSEMMAGQYNTLVVEQDGTEFTLTLNGKMIGTVTKNNIIRIGEVFIGSDAAAGTVGSLHIDNVQIGEPTRQRANEPIPAQNAADVPRDVALAWTPGEYAALHDVYFGTVREDVNSASRIDPLDVLVSQGQVSTAYDPNGLLEFGQTYYWRVDEVNTPPDDMIFKGDIWSFTTEPFAYTVENILATSTVSSDAGVGPENTVNGSGLNDDGEHCVAAQDMWLAAPGAEPLSIQFEFDRLYKLHEMCVWNYNVQFELVLGFGIKDATVEYSADGTAWTALDDVVFAQATARADYQANTTVDFGGVTARFVRLTANSGWGVMGQFGLSEVRFLHIPTRAWQPQPADGEIDISPETMLTWRAGREAVLHEVYLSADREAVADGTALVDAVTGSSYQPSALDPGQTYYWKIDEVNEVEAISVWEGEVWEFTTAD